MNIFYATHGANAFGMATVRRHGRVVSKAERHLRPRTPTRNAHRIRRALYAWLAFGVLLVAWDLADRLDQQVAFNVKAAPAAEFKMR